MHRPHPISLLCGCSLDVDIPCDVPTGVLQVVCPIAGTDDAGDDHTDQPYEVRWNQFVAIKVTQLDVPEPVIDGWNVTPIVVPRVAASSSPGTDDAPPVVGAGGQRPDQPLQPGDVLSSPRTADEWKADAHARGFAHSLLLQQARQIAKDHRLDAPRSLDDIDETLTPLVEEWLDARHPRKAAS